MRGQEKNLIFCNASVTGGGVLSIPPQSPLIKGGRGDLRNSICNAPPETEALQNDTEFSGLFQSLGFTYSLSCIPYFFLNLSIRRAVSTSFCLPVKNGWHFEHISTLRFCFVLLVWITSPQAHAIVVSLYSGCISFFTFFHPLS